MNPDRRSRDDNETTTDPRQRSCPVCAAPFIPIKRQLYDTNACRQIAYRRRTATQPAPVVPTGRRRASTVYLCTDCETRYLGEQWCAECNRPCRRVGLGGECAHCGDLLTVDELLGGELMA
ncbi:MAG: hypothetical protein ACR2JO_09550 [Mycobacteriales bacterium]